MMRLEGKKKKKRREKENVSPECSTAEDKKQSNKSIFWICSTEVTSVICGAKHHIFNIRTEDN